MAIYLHHLDWRVFPPRYVDTNLTPVGLQGITRLSVSLSPASVVSILRLLYSMPCLRYLWMDAATAVRIPPAMLAIWHKRPCPFRDLQECQLWV